MSRGKIKTPEELQNEQFNEFIKQMKEAGVKDKTISLVIKDIHEYQEKQIQKQLERFYKQLWRAYKREVLGIDE